MKIGNNFDISYISVMLLQSNTNPKTYINLINNFAIVHSIMSFMNSSTDVICSTMQQMLTFTFS